MEQFVVHIWDGVSVGGFIVYDSDQPASQPAATAETYYVLFFHLPTT
jgi:hypothetical protein